MAAVLIELNGGAGGGGGGLTGDGAEDEVALFDASGNLQGRTPRNVAESARIGYFAGYAPPEPPAAIQPEDLPQIYSSFWPDAFSAVGDGGAVSGTWQDSSAENHDFEIVGGWTYETNEINGEPVLRSNGTTGYIKPPDAMTDTHLTSGLGYYALWKISSTHAGHNIGNSTGDSIFIPNSDGYIYEDTASNERRQITPQVALNTFHAYYVHGFANNWMLRQNSLILVNDVTNTVAFPWGFNVKLFVNAYNLYMSVDLAALHFFSAPLSNEEWAGLHQAHRERFAVDPWPTYTEPDILTEGLDYVSTLSGAPYTIKIDRDTTLYSDAVIPVGVKLLQENGAKITGPSPTTIEFEEPGLVNPISEDPLFDAEVEGAVFWTPGAAPSEISSHLFYFNNNSAIDRLRMITAACSGSNTRIHWFESVLDGDNNYRVLLNDGHSLVQRGEITNTGTAYPQYPIELGSNSELIGAHGFHIWESSNQTDTRGGTISPHHQSIVSSRNDSLHVVIRGVYFKGHPENTTYDLISGIGLSGEDILVTGCTFDGLHNYNTFIQSIGALAGEVRQARIIGNYYKMFRTQNIAMSHGEDCAIEDNILDYKDAPGNPTVYVPIDIEPNHWDEVIKNLSVSRNKIDVRGMDVGFALMAIAVQTEICDGGYLGGKINGNELITVDSVHVDTNEVFSYYSRFGAHIWGKCLFDVDVCENKAQATYDVAYRFEMSRRIHVLRNTSTKCLGNIKLSGCADSVVADNLCNFPTHTNTSHWRNTIIECELEFKASVSGSIFTVLDQYNIRFKDNHIGLKLIWNNEEFTITDTAKVPASYQTTATVTPTPDALSDKTFTSANVSGDVIEITAHGFNNGCRVRLTSSVTPTADLPAPIVADNGFQESYDTGMPDWMNYAEQFMESTYFVIVDDTNHIRLASTIENATAVTPISVTLTDGGTGTHTIKPILRTRWSNNIYRNNQAHDGVFLAPTGTSRIESTAHDNEITTVNNTDYDIRPADGIVAFDNLTAARNADLPDARFLHGKRFIIKDISGDASTYNITITPLADQTIDGAADYDITTSYGQVQIMADRAGKWHIIG